MDIFKKVQMADLCFADLKKDAESSPTKLLRQSLTSLLKKDASVRIKEFR